MTSTNISTASLSGCETRKHKVYKATSVKTGIPQDLVVHKDLIHLNRSEM